MASTRTAVINLLGRDRASPVIVGVRKALLGLGAVAGAVGTLQLGRKLVDGLQASIAASGVQEKADIALASSLQNVGRSVERNLPALKAMAAGLQDVTGEGDELIQQGQALLIAMGKLEGEGLRRATQAALDLAAANERLSTDASFDLIAKAAAGYTSTLSRYGIILDRNLDPSKKFEAALAQIEERFGGRARAQLEGYEGRLRELKGRYGDLTEAIGGPFREVLTALNRDVLSPTIANTTTSINLTTAYRDAVLDLAIGVAQTLATLEKAKDGIDELSLAGREGLGVINPVQGSLQQLSKLREPVSSFFRSVLDTVDPIGGAFRAAQDATEEAGESLVEPTTLWGQLVAELEKARALGPQAAAALQVPTIELPEGEDAGEERLRQLLGSDEDLDAAISEQEAALASVGERLRGLIFPEADVSIFEQRLEAEREFQDRLLALQLAMTEEGTEEREALALEILERDYQRQLEHAERIGADTTAAFAAFELEKTRIHADNAAAREARAEAERKIHVQTALQAATIGLQILQTAFGQDKAFALAEAIINTARAVTQVLPNIPLAALIAAKGAVEIATIRSQQPRFQFGGIVSGPPGPDQVSARLTRGEGILTTRETSAVLGGRAAIVPIGAAGGLSINVTSPIVIHAGGGGSADEIADRFVDALADRLSDAVRRRRIPLTASELRS